MISRTLVKLIDQAIVPAILLLCTRLSSIILVSYYFKIGFSFDSTGFVFASGRDYLLINSYSTFFMMLVLTVGIFYILFKALIFHDTHITPVLTAKLFNIRFSAFIQSSFELYSQGVIWLAYLYLLVVVSGILAFSGLLYNWVFYVSIVLSIISTVILIFDVEHEMKIMNQENEFIEDDTPSGLYLEVK